MKREVIDIVNLRRQKPSRRPRSTIVPFALLAMWATTAFPSLAQQPAQPAQPTFPSPADAIQSLFQAVQSNNEQTIASILGGPTELTSSRDPGQDKVDRELFVKKYQEMHRLGREANRSVTLYIGAENWPFPIPIVEKNGAWRFDSDAGQKEVLFRRIGENEFTAIAMCRGFVASKRQNLAKSSSASPEDNSASRLVADSVSGSIGGDPVLMDGYYFRAMNTATPGRFAMIAYPAEYRTSGVMTFVITAGGVVYEKDLGANTTKIATAMTAFRRDATWHPADE